MSISIKKCRWRVQRRRIRIRIIRREEVEDAKWRLCERNDWLKHDHYYATLVLLWSSLQLCCAKLEMGTRRILAENARRHFAARARIGVRLAWSERMVNAPTTTGQLKEEWKILLQVFERAALRRRRRRRRSKYWYLLPVAAYLLPVQQRDWTLRKARSQVQQLQSQPSLHLSLSLSFSRSLVESRR